MINLIRKILELLDRSSRRRILSLLFVVIGMSFTEFIGVAVVFPFMQLASDPSKVSANGWFSWIYDSLGFQSNESFVMFSGLVVILCLVTNAACSIFGNWFEQKIVWESMTTLSVQLLTQYATQPYAFFLKEGTSDLGAKVLLEVSQLTTRILLPLTQLFSGLAVSVSIFSLLFVVDAMLAIQLIVVLCVTYVTIYTLTRAYTHRLGVDRKLATIDKFRFATELLDSIKAVKVHGKEQAFVGRFEKAATRLSNIEPNLTLVSNSPRYLIETVAFSGIILILLVHFRSGLENILPTLTLFAVAGYRLLPSLQRMFVAANTIRFSQPILDSIYADIESMVPTKKSCPDDLNKMPYSRSIVFESVSFRHQNSDQLILNNLSFEVAKHQHVAFVGPSGAGKTTLVDLLIGLLSPTSGVVRIDHEPLLEANTRHWQNVVGYVPQDVALYDDSIARNIAFGCNEEELDFERIVAAAKLAQIHDFIDSQLEFGYETSVGDRGVRLSGGQRQRIGLARALYHDPSVLILDEATSALDGITEEAVMESVRLNAGERTIIVIAHRLSTVRDCDVIFVLESGQIAGQGTYEELIENNPLFRQLAKTSDAGEAFVANCDGAS